MDEYFEDMDYARYYTLFNEPEWVDPLDLLECELLAEEDEFDYLWEEMYYE